MALVKIDISDLVANVTRSLPAVSDIDEVRRKIAAGALNHWTRKASEGLRSTSRDYIKGLSMQDHGESTWLVLAGDLPNWIENGISAYDMRDTLLKGPNARMGENGMYNTVPFRHGTPGTGGRNVGNPMPPAIYRAAKKLQDTRSRPQLSRPLPKSGGRTVLYGERLKPDMRGMSKQVSKMLTTKAKPWHTTSVWTGMMRPTKQYEKVTQTGGYLTFRRISRASDPRAWKHPGIKPRHYARSTQRYIEETLPFALREAMGGSR